MTQANTFTRPMKSAPRICAQCRSNYADCDEPDVGPADAEFYVQGSMPRYSDDRAFPYRAYLCDGHVEIALEDGATFHTIRPLIEAN